MHRQLVRRSLPFSTVLLLAFLGSGCGFVYPTPAIPEAVQKKVFQVSDPIALLTFEPGRTAGTVIGEVHGWPLPHLEGGESISTSAFTYVGHFKVTAQSEEDAMPSTAQGTRTVYFHESPPQLSLGDAHVYGTGQEAAVDAISMSFAFKEGHQLVAVRLISQQKSARPFAYKGQRIEPPATRDTGEALEGDYSGELGGYVLRNINE